MRVALLRPGYSVVYDLYKVSSKVEAVVPPIGLMCIAANLEKHGHEVRIFDLEMSRTPIDELISELQTFDPGLVGLGTATPTYFIAQELASKLKSALNVPVALGGPHASILSENVLNETPAVDYVARHEGEQTIVELVEALEGRRELTDVQGIYYRDGIQVHKNPDRKLCENLDDLPMQSFHLIDHDKYMHSVPLKGMRKMGAVLTSRGCPSQCTFCCRVFGKHVRERSISNVMDEVEYLLTKLGVQWVTFYDDTLLLKKSRVLAFCEEIHRRQLKFDWQCFARVNNIDDEIVEHVVEAGCKIISVGIESGNDEILKQIRKGTTVELVRKATSIISKHPVELRGSFILGLPWETQETLADTYKLIMELPLNRVNVNICTPYPGTSLYDQALEGAGIHLLSADWREFRRHGHAVIRTDELSPEDLVEAQKKFVRDFYTRPSVLRYHVEQFIAGERDMFYYRPLVHSLQQVMENAPDAGGHIANTTTCEKTKRGKSIPKDKIGN